jgi:hypothetical protein
MARSVWFVVGLVLLMGSVALAPLSSPAWATAGGDYGDAGSGETTNNPPGSFEPQGNPFGGGGGGGGSTGDNNPDTAPFGQVVTATPGVVLEPPPQTDWGPVTITVGPPPGRVKTYDWDVDGLVWAQTPQWALHNLSLMYKAGKMSAVDYAQGVAMTLGLAPGTTVTIGY